MITCAGLENKYILFDISDLEGRIKLRNELKVFKKRIMEKKTTEYYLRKWSSFEFDEWKKEHPQGYKLVIKSIEDVLYEKEQEIKEWKNSFYKEQERADKLRNELQTIKKILRLNHGQFIYERNENEEK